MNGWLHNPIADLPGHDFLVIYVLAIVATIVAVVLVVRSADVTSTHDLPEVPTKPDPYEIAYLLGGKNQVIRTAVFSLVQQGLVEVEAKKSRIFRTSLAPEEVRLDAIENAVYEAIPSIDGVAASSLFGKRELTSFVETQCAPMHKQLENQEMLNPPETRKIIAPTGTLGSLIVIGLGGYKFLVAIAKGRNNVGFLIVLAIVGTIAVFIASALALPRVSRRGRAYLDRLRLAYGSLKTNLSMAEQPTPDMLLAVSLFGFGVLSGTAYNDLNLAFARAASGGGCGAGCGGGGGGCGGGGCGGGGCGGCGG